MYVCIYIVLSMLKYYYDIIIFTNWFKLLHPYVKIIIKIVTLTFIWKMKHACYQIGICRWVHVNTQFTTSIMNTNLYWRISCTNIKIIMPNQVLILVGFHKMRESLHTRVIILVRTTLLSNWYHGNFT